MSAGFSKIDDHQFKPCECGCGNCQHFASGQDICCLGSPAQHAFVSDDEWGAHLAEIRDKVHRKRSIFKRRNDFQMNVLRMLGAIRDGNEADAFIFAKIVAREIYAKRPNLRLPSGWEDAPDYPPFY